MTKKIILLSVFIFQFISCNTKETEYLGRKNVIKITDSDFKEDISLVSESLPYMTDQLILPGRLLLLDDFLIVTERKSDKTLHVIDLKTEKYMGMFVNKGEGPNEIRSPWTVSKIDNTSFIIADFRQRKYLCYTIDELMNSSIPFLEEKLEQNGITDNLYYNKNLDKLFYSGTFTENHMLFEKELTSGKIIGHSTLLDANGSLNNIEVKNHLSFKQSHSNSDNTFFAFTYAFAPVVETFDINTKMLKTITLPHTNEPIYKSVIHKDGSTSVGVINKTITEFCDVYMSDNYIYALYSGKTIGEKKSKTSIIYVFDLELNPIKKYNLDAEIQYFEVKDDTIIYGLDFETDIYPRIAKYNLK
ncbi:BF3164 family lipoprotein [Aquimarina aggregata]|uniref:BF3164 family lipoprotein n=1 Tax=Aquimarina aggregata TaxID=1642818 RepID=UPI002490FFFB|nr:BF3164 family lipoprotein [Aquimarina aggregata]